MQLNLMNMIDQCSLPQINIWGVAGDEIIGLNDLFYLSPHKEIKGVQMFFHETSHLYMHTNQKPVSRDVVSRAGPSY